MRLYIASALIALITVGCTSTPENTSIDPSEAILPTQHCVFPDSPKQPAPQWICEEKVQGIALEAMGMSEIRHGGIAHQRRLAILDAQSVLAQQLTADVNDAVNNFVATQGLDNDGLVTAESMHRKQAGVNHSITGMRIYQGVVSEAGTYYVLVGLNEESHKQNVKQQLASVVNTNLGSLIPTETPMTGQDIEQARQQLIDKLTAYATQ